MANWSLEETGAVKTISIFVSVHQRRRMRLLNGIRYDEQKNIILNFIILQQINNTTREKNWIKKKKKGEKKTQRQTHYWYIHVK